MLVYVKKPTETTLRAHQSCLTCSAAAYPLQHPAHFSVNRRQHPATAPCHLSVTLAPSFCETFKLSSDTLQQHPVQKHPSKNVCPPHLQWKPLQLSAIQGRKSKHLFIQEHSSKNARHERQGKHMPRDIERRERKRQRDTERHRETQRDTERHRETKRDTERHRETQRDTDARKSQRKR